MVPWRSIDKLVFNAGKHHQADQLVGYVAGHLPALISCYRIDLVAMRADGKVNYSRCFCQPQFREQATKSQDPVAYLLQISVRYYQHFPQLSDCLVSLDQVRDSAVQNIWRRSHLKQCLGYGLWDAHGNLRYIFSLARRSQHHFTPAELRTGQVLFDQLNNLYHNLTVRPQICLPSFLTNREREVALLVADGLNNNEIAARLVISPKTVATHMAHLYRKFGVQSRSELLVALCKPGT